MGYHVSSIQAVSPNDKHAFFIYFIPGRDGYFENTNFDNINSFIAGNFSKIAEAIGPEGVIIAPTNRYVEEFICEVAEISMNGCIFCYTPFAKPLKSLLKRENGKASRFFS